jgi:hypothetical protein
MSEDPHINAQYARIQPTVFTKSVKHDDGQYEQYSNEDFRPRKSNTLAILGVGLAGGALIGAAIFFMVMPGIVPIIEKKVEVAAVLPPVNMVAPPQQELPKVILPPPVIVETVAPPPPVKTVTLPKAEILALISRAKNAINEGDISLARTFLERAANAGDSTSLLMLGETYDANILKTWGTRGVKADTMKARELYTRALTAGEPSAISRLDSLR